MGFASPAAIGAKMGAQDRHVVAVIGDGGYHDHSRVRTISKQHSS